MRLPVAAVAVCLSGAVMTAQERRPADAVVEAPWLILEIPAGNTTSEVIESALQAAGVNYGLERVPSDPSGPPIDLGRTPDRRVPLDGLKLRDALDAIVREDPRYEWEETDGRIIVRAAALRGVGALDARVERFAVKDVSAGDALAAVDRALTRGESIPDVRSSSAAPQAGSDASGATTSPGRAAEHRITVSLLNPTLLDILEGIARAHGALSWMVSYVGEATPGNAVISLSTGASSVTVVPPRLARDATGRRDRVRIPITGSLESMLSLYADGARVQVGIELVSSGRSHPSPDAPPLDLSGLSPGAAISRIVALDSRYVWEDAGGIFNVGPGPGVTPGPSLLDQPLESFAVFDVTAGEALDALVRALGGKRPSAGEGHGSDPYLGEHEQKRRIAEERARRLSLTLTATTVRQTLNALCRTHGTLSWSVRAVGAEQRRREYTITLSSYHGWSMSRTFSAQ